MKSLLLLIIVLININLFSNHPIQNKKQKNRLKKKDILKEDIHKKLAQLQDIQLKKKLIESENKTLDLLSEQNVKRLKAMIREEENTKIIKMLQSGSSMCNNIREMFDNSEQLKKLAEGWIQEKTGVLVDLQEDYKELKENEIIGGLLTKAEEKINKGMNYLVNKVDQLSDLIQTQIGSIKGYKQFIELQNAVKNAKDDKEKQIAMKVLEDSQTLFQNKIVQSLFLNNNFLGNIISKSEKYQYLLKKVVSNINDIDLTLKTNLDSMLKNYNDLQVQIEVAKENVQNQVQILFADLIEKRVNPQQFYQIIQDKKQSQDQIQQKFILGINQNTIDQLTKNSQILLKITDQKSLEYQQESQNWIEQINVAKEQMIQNVELEYISSFQQNIENIQQKVEQSGKLIIEKYEKVIDKSKLDLVNNVQNELNMLNQQYQNLKIKIFEKAQEILNEDLNYFISKGEQYLSNKLIQYYKKSEQFIIQSKEKIKYGFGVDISIENIKSLVENPMKFTLELVQKKLEISEKVMKSKDWLDKKSQQYGFNDLEEVKEKCQEWVDKKVEQAQKGLTLLNKGNEALQKVNSKVQKTLKNNLVSASLKFLGPIGIGITAGAELLQTASKLSQQVIDQIYKQKQELEIYYQNAKKQLILYKQQLIDQVQFFFNVQLFQMLSKENIEVVIKQIEDIGKNPDQFIIQRVCKMVDKQKVTLMQSLTKQINNLQQTLLVKTVRFKKSKKRMAKVEKLNELQKQYDDLTKDIREKVGQQIFDERNKELDSAVNQAKVKLEEASKDNTDIYNIENLSNDLQIVIKDEVQKLTDNINEKFDKIDDKQQLIAAKLNIQKSMDILLYAIDQVNQIKQACESQNAEIVMLKVDQLQCKIAQRKYLFKMSYLNFDYYYKQMLRIYAGQKDIQGMNYYDLLVKLYKQEEISKQYEVIQEVIQKATLAYLVYNQIDNKFQINSILIEQNSLNQQVDNVDTILQITNCRNCMTLDQDNQLFILAGDAIYCERIQSNLCKDSKIDRINQLQLLSEDQQKMIQSTSYDLKTQLIKFFTEFNSKFVAQAPTQNDLNIFIEDIKKNIPDTYKDDLRVHSINLNFKNKPQESNYIFFSENTDKFDKYQQINGGSVNNYIQDYNNNNYNRIFIIQQFYHFYQISQQLQMIKKKENYFYSISTYLKKSVENYLNKFKENANSILGSQQYCKDLKDSFQFIQQQQLSKILICVFNLYSDQNIQFNFKSIQIPGEKLQIRNEQSKIVISHTFYTEIVQVKYTITSYLNFYQISIIFENVGKMEIFYFTQTQK